MAPGDQATIKAVPARRSLTAGQAAAAGVAVQVGPPLLAMLLALRFGIARLPAWSSSMVVMLIAGAAVLWCLWSAELWKQWVSTVTVDRARTERLALSLGLIWRKL